MAHLIASAITATIIGAVVYITSIDALREAVATLQAAG